VPYSHVPTQREPVDIEQMAEMSPENIEADTNARLLDSKRRQEVATITSNYREMDAQKRGAVVINCQDLNLLYRLLGMETAATVSAYIQNKILELGGRLPTAEEMQQIQQANATTSGAPAQLQPVIAPSLFQPATTPLNPMRDLITRYVMGEMAGQEKVAFIPKLRDLDQLNKLLKIEGSDGIKAMISAQITQVQAVVQAAEAAPNMPGRPTTAPLKPEEVVMDKTLTPPPAPGCTCGNLQMQNGQLVFTQDGGNPVTTAPDGKVQCPKCGGWMAMPGSPAAVAPTPVTPPALPTNEPSANGPQA
jgi:hypothetical protein